jgi:hypothetical protein
MYRETEQELKARLARNKTRMFEWARQALPDPTYDSQNGWKLDQFAMHFQPELVYRHKLYVLEQLNPMPVRETVTDPSGVVHVVTNLSGTFNEIELGQAINALFLTKRFRVTGFRPGSYTEETIPLALLETLYPVIETCELVEGSGLANAGRRFEHVRVFRSETVSSKRKRGKPEQYTYLDEADEIERKEIRFASKAELIRYLIPRLRWVSTGKIPKNPPDYHTVSDAIDRHGLMKFVIKD